MDEPKEGGYFDSSPCARTTHDNKKEDPMQR